MAAKSLHLHLLHHLRRAKPIYASATPPLRLLSLHSKPINLIPTKSLSTTATPYPLQYEMIISRPANPPPPQRRRRHQPAALPKSQTENSKPDPEMGFEEWVDKKLSSKDADNNSNKEVVMDKAKRKYYNKRRKRMYGESESDEENGRNESDFIELKQEVVELRTLHKREEELYFYDTFAYPWEKNKHYKMVYQMEKKYFPDQCFDKAFLEPNAKGGKKGSKGVEGKGEEDKGMVFFEESEKEGKDVDVTEKKVEDFFKCLKKFPNENGGDVEPFLSTRSVGLPPKWDGPNGTVVLVNKPKGEIFYDNASALGIFECRLEVFGLVF